MPDGFSGGLPNLFISYILLLINTLNGKISDNDMMVIRHSDDNNDDDDEEEEEDSEGLK